MPRRADAHLPAAVHRADVGPLARRLGFTTTDRTQRIDVTGHVASAFMKSIENGIACAAG